MRYIVQGTTLKVPWLYSLRLTHFPGAELQHHNESPHLDHYSVSVIVELCPSTNMPLAKDTLTKVVEAIQGACRLALEGHAVLELVRRECVDTFSLESVGDPTVGSAMTLIEPSAGFGSEDTAPRDQTVNSSISSRTAWIPTLCPTPCLVWS